MGLLDTFPLFCVLLAILCNEPTKAFPQNVDIRNDPIEDNLLVPPDSYEAELNINMLKRKEEMYLQTLKKLIPAMESLREEITSKLAANAGIEEESEVADLKMLIIENQLRASQASVKKYMLLQNQVNNVTKDSHDLLDSMNKLYSCHSQTSDLAITTQNLEYIKTLKEFLKQKPYPTDKIMKLIKDQQTDAGRIVLILKLLQNIEISKETLHESPLLIRIGVEINKTESSSLDLSLLPDIIRDIFTSGNKIIKSAKTGRNLIVTEGKAQTTSDHDSSIRSWHFIPTPNRTAFLIRDSEAGLVLGVGRRDMVQDVYLDVERDSIGTTPSTTDGEETELGFITPKDVDRHNQAQLEITTGSPENVFKNLTYHWNIITTFGTRPDKIYVKFVNAAYGQVLDANSYGDVYPLQPNDGDYQKWMLF